ncbi:DUF896 domain-containing protein [Spiroplasma alleghenense]|uniref:Uncharacterized protein n=1 Tax=Spiroplasma alleghenense TaxID=216931 RepID=A0A345Z3K7_9MOLU|nr:DUF896 domain-containing protein [Spiroplasma alleghenense]AXK51186.1 hypothetical protein SALLE_v1c05120 [Spiroplasma alleghenense]
MEKLIKRINELSQIAKDRDLTLSETNERTLLREEYIKNFRAGFKQHLEAIKVVDKDGNDITPKRK